MNTEQKQRIEQIREHLAQRKAETPPLPSTEIYIAHVDFLLSLVKSREAEPSIRVSPQWIIDHHKSLDIDYACFECCRDRDDSTVVDGFVCVYHRAKAAIQEQEAKQS